MSDSPHSKYRYLFSNIIAFFCGSFGTKLIGFLMVPLYTNVLLPEEYGEIDLVLSLAGVLTPFLACGIHEGIMRFSLDRNANHKLVFSIGLRFFFISSGVFIVISPILLLVPVVSTHTWFLVAYCLLNQFMTIILCYIRGKDNIKLYAFLGFLHAFLSAIFNILFLTILNYGIFGYKLSMIIAPISTSIVAVILGKLCKDFSLSRWDTKLSREIFKYSFALLPNAILWWCINASDRFFVTFFCGADSNGLYAVSYKIPTILTTVSAVFMQSWQMSAIKLKENEDDGNFTDQIYRSTIFITGLLTMLLIIANKEITQIYVGADYRSAWTYSIPLMIAFFAGALSNFWGSFYIAEKNTRKYLTSAIFGAISNVVLNFILIKFFGIIGAAIATAISYFVVLIVRAVGINKTVKLPLLNKQFVCSTICLIFISVISYLPWYIKCPAGFAIIAVFLIVNSKELKEVARILTRL